MAQQFKKVFERFERHDKIFDQHSKVLESILTEIQKTNQEAKEHRMMMSTLNQTDVSQQRKIQGLELRIEKLEEKVK